MRGANSGGALEPLLNGELTNPDRGAPRDLSSSVLVSVPLVSLKMSASPYRPGESQSLLVWEPQI